MIETRSAEDIYRAMLQKALKGILVFLVLISSRAGAMDVSWIPDEDNAPLPLSSSYRNSLRRLCSLIKSGKSLPPEVKAKKRALDAQCKKLDADDQNISMGNKEGGAGLSALSLTLALAGLVGVLVNSSWGQEILDSVKGFIDRKLTKRSGKNRLGVGVGRRLGDGDSASIAEDIVRMREARLKALSMPSSVGGVSEELLDD